MAEIQPKKLAIATNNGQNIDACFGQVREFQIYKDTANGYELTEVRPGLSFERSQNHDLANIISTVCLIKDCEIVLAKKIGPAAIRILSEKGITGLAVSLKIDEALKRLKKH